MTTEDDDFAAEIMTMSLDVIEKRLGCPGMDSGSGESIYLSRCYRAVAAIRREIDRWAEHRAKHLHGGQGQPE